MKNKLLLLLVPTLCAAQNISSVISGTLNDASGATVPSIPIVLTNDDQGFTTKTETNGSGFFSFPDLKPGTYSISLKATGFRPYKQDGIELSSSEQRNLGTIQLVVGNTTDAITVIADAVSVNTVSGEKSATLNAKELDGMALRGRDIFDAISLLPGVVDTSDGRDAPGPTSIGNIFIAGGRNDQKNMTVDGVTNLDTGSNGSVHSMPSMASVGEVKVLSSNYSAEYGRNSGGTVTIITKGGSQQFHGTGEWSYRHEDLNANDFFNNQAGRPRTPYRYNIAGYTISGPALLPKINSGRNKLFFMFSQEYQHQRVAYGTKRITVPTALERQGDFSQSFDVNSKLILIRDPLTGATCSTTSAAGCFAGNKIPASRITQIGKNVLNLFPQPNYVDPNPTNLYQWNYFTSEAGGYNRRTESLRVDFQPASNWQLYARLTNNSDLQHAPYGLWVNGSLNYDITPIAFAQPGRGAVLHSTWTITPSMFNETIIGVSQNTLTYTPDDPSKLDRTALGITIPQRNPSLNVLNLIPNMTFGSIANAANPSLSDGTPYFNRNTIYSFVDNVTKITGTHSIKAGFYVELTRKVQFANAAVRGTIKFDKDTLNPLDANDAYANALLGNYDSYAEANGRPRGDYRFKNIEWFFQDTWKVNRRLSLDFGVRFYHDPPQYDNQYQLTSFAPSLYNAANAPVLLTPGFDAARNRVAVNPRNGATYPQALIGTFAPGYGYPAVGMYFGGKDGHPAGMYDLPPVGVAPRFGFAFDPTGSARWVIRGGAGIAYDRLEGNPTMGTISNPPTIFTPTTYYGAISDIAVQVASGFLAPTGTVYSLGSPGKLTSVYNYSLGVQHQIGHAGIMEVSYVGSLGRHLIWERNINAVPLGSTYAALHPELRDPTNTANALPANFLRPYQGYGDIYLYEFAGTSNYNSLQASYSHLLGRRGSVGASYTFSKALDESDGYSSAVDPFYNPRTWNYGPAGFDRPQVFSSRFVLNLPNVPDRMSFRLMRYVTNSWITSGIYRFQSGAPITPSYSLVTGYDYTGSASTGSSIRPTVLDPNAPIETRFGPPVYVANTPTLGNVGKGVLRGPGTDNLDLSVYKDIKVTERVKGQLRLESYNTLNHSQFSAVDSGLKFQTNVSTGNINPLFMQPTTARPPRRVALALRISF